MLKCSEDLDERQLYEARCQKEYNASISKTQMIRQVWRPTVEERTCAQAAAHKEPYEFKKKLLQQTLELRKRRVMAAFNFIEEAF